MAKNDHKRMLDEVNKQGNDLVYGIGGTPVTPDRTIGTRGHFNPLGGTTIPGKPAVNGIGGLNNTYESIFGSKGMQTYDDIMNAYRNFNSSGDMNASRSAYSDLASGGVDGNAIRDRAMREVRSSYSGARRNLDRQRSIQGGYSPGYTTALTRMAREEGQGAADASTNAEAAIQELISRNKVTGAGGLANLAGMDMNAISGMNNVFGNMNSNRFKFQDLQNQIAQLMMQGRTATSQIPGNFANALGNIGGVLNLGGKIVGGMVGLGGPQIPKINPAGLGTF